MFIAHTRLAHWMMALPVDRLTVPCLFIGLLLVSFSTWLLPADEIERCVARTIARWRRRSGNQTMPLLQFVTLAGATIFAMPALAQTSGAVPCGAPYTEIRLGNTSTSVLHQNSPEPFWYQTTISYELPDKLNEARLMFYDAQGKLMKTVDITQTAVGDEDAQCAGLGRVTVFADDLPDGTYTYVLVVDGQVVGSKTMTKSG